MSGLIELAWRSLVERRGRAALTLAGLVLGVALFTASLVTVSTARNLVIGVSKDVMGAADAMVSPVGGGGGVLGGFALTTFPEASARQLMASEAVESAAVLLTFPSALETSDGRRTDIRVNAPPPIVVAGVEADSATEVLGLQVDGRLPASADEIVLPLSTAQSLGIDIGDDVMLDTPSGRRAVTTVGVARKEGIGRVGTIAFADLQTAQAWSGRPDQVSQVAVRLARGWTSDEYRAEVRRTHGEEVDIEDLDDLVAFMQGFVATIAGALTALGGAVVFLGGFLFYLTMSMAVAERTRVYALLSSIGARRSQIRRAVMVESALIGILAAAIAVPSGIGLSVVIRAASQRLLEQAGASGGSLSIPWWSIVAGVSVAVAATVIAGLAPARRAAALDPVIAMRTGALDDPRPSLRTSVIGGAALGAGAGSLAVASTLPAALFAGLILVLLGAVLCTPLLLRPVAAVVGVIGARLAPGTGDVAVQHLTSQRTRSSYTIALIMLVMALAIAAGATHTSFVTALDRQIDKEFGNDLRVEAATTLSPAFLDALDDVPGVDEMAPIAYGSGAAVDSTGQDHIIQLGAIEPKSYFAVGSYSWIDGDDASARAALERGRAAIVPAGLAERLGTRAGGTIRLRTREGVVEFIVAATAEISNIPPTVDIARGDAVRFFGIGDPQAVQVNVASGADVASVRRQIETDLADRGTFIVSTGSDLKADARAQVAGGLNGVFVLLLLAGIVGVLGLANTIAMSVIQRTREIGVLRAIGARARDIRRMVAAEAFTLVAAAFVLAVPLGIAISGPLLAAVRVGLANTTVPYEFPWIAFPIVVAAGSLAAVGAAILPARRAVAVDVDTTLRFD